jgi:hypothetical protein
MGRPFLDDIANRLQGRAIAASINLNYRVVVGNASKSNSSAESIGGKRPPSVTTISLKFGRRRGSGCEYRREIKLSRGECDTSLD